MKLTTGTVSGASGNILYRQAWLSDEEPRAALLIVHGIGEHSGRYGNVVDALVPQGYAVYGYDHRGHGRSAGKRGYIDRWSDYRDDLARVRAFVGKEIGDTPLFLMGHSMGGLVVADYVLHHPDGLAGVVLSAPALDSGGGPAWLITAGKILEKFAPGLQLASPLEKGILSRDPAVEEAYRADPLVHLKNTPRWLVEILKTMEWVHANAALWRPPVLIIHGDADRLVPIGGTHRFYANMGGDDKTLRVLPETRHEPHNDINYAENIALVADWLAAHAG